MNRPAVLLGAVPVGLLAAVLVAGCSGTARAPCRATTGTCYAFAVQALERRVTVTTVPRACAGLSHEQIDLAVTRAIRSVVGRRSKVAGRRLAHREIAYLVHLIKAAPVPRPAPVAARLPGRHRGRRYGSPRWPSGWQRCWLGRGCWPAGSCMVACAGASPAVACPGWSSWATSG